MDKLDKIILVDKVMKDIYKFVCSDEILKNDFHKYLKSINAENASKRQIERLFVPYVFERKLNNPPESIIEIYNSSAKSSEPEMIKSFLNARYSVFKIESVQKFGFELYDLINEKTDNFSSITRMVKYRGISAGDYISAGFFKYNGEYYLIEIDKVFYSAEAADAARYAIVKLVSSPWIVYEDNPEKEKEIQNGIETMYNKFIKLFGTDEIITTNAYADNIIGILNDEDDIKNLNMDDAVKPLNEYKFFKIKELNNSYDNFLENSLGGFSSHSEIYDVGIIYDRELGLYSIPFYKTFCMIFENCHIVENAKECITYFLTNSSISDNIIKRVSAKYPDFIEKINKILNTDYTFDKLIETYKSEFLKRKIYSPASVLYHSVVFSTSLEMIDKTSVEKNMQKISSTISDDSSNKKRIKIGRNAPCPCGSGKKYKNCCLK